MRRLLPALLLLTGCATGLRPIPSSWLEVPAARRIGSITLDAEGKVAVSQREPVRTKDGTFLTDGRRIFAGVKPITPEFEAVDSLDYSESREELVFSARRADGYDVALVASDGSVLNWIPSDPADEIAAQWAPRGNKVSYVVRAPGADIVRTVHVPTAHSLSVGFPLATIRDLAWDPQAERYAVLYSTIDSSDQVEVARYGGEERRVAIAPSDKLDLEVEPFGPGAVLLRPRDIGYDERLPLVIWTAADHGWSDARAALMRRARVVCVVTTREVSEELLRRAGELTWIDASRSWVIAADRASWHPPGATMIFPDPAVPAGHYRGVGGFVAAPPAVVQSLAAGIIADQLERNPPRNGSR